MKELLLLFTSLWFDIYVIFSTAIKKYKIAAWKKKEFENLKDLFVSYRLYLLIAEKQLIYLYNVLFATSNISYLWYWL
jgi:hypothetical protein